MLACFMLSGIFLDGLMSLQGFFGRTCFMFNVDFLAGVMSCRAS